MTETMRRVITGLDDQGRSTVVIDDRIPLDASRMLWVTDALPADNSGTEDTGAREFTFDMFRNPGSTFMLAVFQPGDPANTFMHATDTIDYVVVVKGRVALTLETGVVTLGPGDCLVDRGVMHSWEVAGDEPVVMMTVLLPAHPVGAGATI